MTDISKHGLAPVAWLYRSADDDEQHLMFWRENVAALVPYGTEAPLYRADQVAEVVERLEAALRAIITHYDGRTWWGTDAPGHAHKVAGTLDATGKPCEWCAKWNDARAALEGKKP